MARDTGTDIKLISLSNYIRPQIVESRSDDWVLNGRKNWFYQYIIDRKNGSATNSAIINSYVDLIYGKGIGAKNAGMRVDDWLKLKQILKPKTLHRIVSDFALFGEASFEIIQNKGGGLSEINHVPKQKLVPNIANEDNEIEVYWYSNNWAKIGQNKPESFKAFNGEGNAQSMYVIQPYSAGKDYFADPPYLSGMPYAEMEEEIANLNINSIKNGLSAGYIINIPDGKSLSSEEKQEFENKIKQRLTGSTNASQFIISFNGRDVEVTITPFPVNDNIHKQWQFLTSEARQQLLTAHRVVSPMLFGIKDSTGLGNNANELEVAEAQLMKRVVAPMQNHITTAIEEVLEAYDINLDLYFIPLTELKTQLSVQQKEEDFAFLEMYAQDAPDGYEITDGAEYELQLSANQTSEQDNKRWKIRYAYTIGTSKTPQGKSRTFCNKMVSLSDKGKVFRKEDIELMSSQGVNGQFAHSGGKYDIFLYGGGVNCYHRWERRVFKKKLNKDGEPYGGGALQQTTEVNVNEAKRQGAKIPKNSPDVAIAEITKPNKGAYPG
jgi:hypothetical protein